MKATPVTDMNNDGAVLRVDGRLMCNMYPMTVKTPKESTGPFDVYKLTATLTGEQAFRPLSAGGCSLAT